MLAIAVVLVSAGVGMLLPVRGGRGDVGATTNDGNVLNLMRQGIGQRDENLKLLLAQKMVVGVHRDDGDSSRDDRRDPGGNGHDSPGS